MPEIVRLSNSKICMYVDDHEPPHFHLTGPGWQASVDLTTLAITAGRAPRRDLDEALQWVGVAENRARLFSEWSRLNERD
jgi:hypothetical protein